MELFIASDVGALLSRKNGHPRQRGGRLERYRLWALNVPATKVEIVAVGDWEIALRVPRDKNKLLEDYIEWNLEDLSPGESERVPYWADLWPSALVLSNEIICRRSEFQGSLVLEIGCGLGLCGMAAALAGAESVLLSDNDPLAVDVARMNAENNSRILPEATVEHRILDWRAPAAWPRDFDIVIAADVLYEPSFADDIANLLPLVLKKGGRLLLADPFIRPHREYFLDSLRTQGKWKDIRKTTVSQQSQNIVFVTAVLG
ncbi:hypothetical protein NDN08_001399 [Rhodosorus marinus]|uniref:Calmodulin-lysine N-methyltransferase n=1 Tax=Rhodosorus marinus TaxID=101924 RepID=A0AAV8UQN9_9RHOD|nr:hypothetical protein NDN08_001399 [Rhodosorus marinus]